MKVIDPATATNVDLTDIRMIKKLGYVGVHLNMVESKNVRECDICYMYCKGAYWKISSSFQVFMVVADSGRALSWYALNIISSFACRGTVEDTELIDGLVFSQKTAGYGGPNKLEKAKIGLIQFCVSPPKTDMENQVPLLYHDCTYCPLSYSMLLGVK